MRFTRNPKLQCIALDKRIQTVWKNLKNRRIDLGEFIENSLYFVNELHEMLNIWENDGRVDGKAP